MKALGALGTVGTFLLAAAALYAALLVLLWFGQEKLIFLPSKLGPNHRFDFGADVHEVWIERPAAEPGSTAGAPVRLHALHLRLPAPEGIVFYLHGNAGSLQGWFSNPDFYRRANFDLFMLDYRGYGKSEGRVTSEAQLVDDVRAAWAQVAPAYEGRRRIVYGRSLGSGLAAQLAAEVQPELTVLISPYQSLEALAAEHYAWVPKALLRYPLRTDQALARVKGPVLLVHGDDDEIIGPHHSRALLTQAQRSTPPSHGVRMLQVPGAGHNDLQNFPVYLEGLRSAIVAR